MIEIETRKSVDVVDITDQVERTMQESCVENGILLVYSLHTTTGLTTNEADGALLNDIMIYRVFCRELDGPRRRSIFVRALAD